MNRLAELNERRDRLQSEIDALSGEYRDSKDDGVLTRINDTKTALERAKRDIVAELARTRNSPSPTASRGPKTAPNRPIRTIGTRHRVASAAKRPCVPSRAAQTRWEPMRPIAWTTWSAGTNPASIRLIRRGCRSRLPHRVCQADHGRSGRRGDAGAR